MTGRARVGWRRAGRRRIVAALGALVLAPSPAVAQLDTLRRWLGFERVQGEWTGDLDGMLERRQIRLLVVPSRTFYFVDKGTQRGISYDLGQALEKELNEKRGPSRLRVDVIYVPTRPDELLPALLRGTGDVAAANLTITPERQEWVDFSAPLWSDVSEIVVTGPSAPEIRSSALWLSTTARGTSPALRGRGAARGRGRVRLPQAEPAAGGLPRRLRAPPRQGHTLRQPEVQAVLEEYEVREECHDPGGVREAPPDDRDLPQVRRAVRLRLADAGCAGLPGVATRPEREEPGRAVGIMQVMPATGKEMGVGDIQQIEANIHAGTKYLRTVLDRYFPDAEFDGLNRQLFAFASYNAGPARVAKLRKEAEKRGLDPNLWFNHVELVAAERVGQEPVRYVANIYKYYIAYRLVADAQTERERAKQAAATGR